LFQITPKITIGGKIPFIRNLPSSTVYLNIRKRVVLRRRGWIAGERRTWVSAYSSDKYTVPLSLMFAKEYRRWVYRSTGIFATEESEYTTQFAYPLAVCPHESLQEGVKWR